ncbi:MAG: cell division protein FtsA [Candidatus Omnitrophota bacterium]
MLKLNNYICGLDIGSDKISATVARIKNKKINSLFFETSSSKGVNRGVIVDSVELIGRISGVLEDLKSKSGINIKSLYVNVSGKDIILKHSHAVLPLAEKGNKVITFSDIIKVNEQARILGSSLEEEIIHKIPLKYSIDSANDILHPLGLYSHRLEVDLYLICAKMPFVHNLTRVINQAGYEVKNLFFSGLAASRAVLGQQAKEGVNVVCDIGKDITEVLIFKEGNLKITEILPLGGNDLSLKISDALKIPFELAEEVKKSHTSIGDYDSIQEDKEILVRQDNVYNPIKQKLISEILTVEAKLICQSIKQAIEKTLPCTRINNFTVVGRTVLLGGFLETLEESLGIPVKLGRINHPEINGLVVKDEVLSGQKYLSYIISLGLIIKALETENESLFNQAHPARNLLFKAVNRVKEVYQEYF